MYMYPTVMLDVWFPVRRYTVLPCPPPGTGIVVEIVGIFTAGIAGFCYEPKPSHKSFIHYSCEAHRTRCSYSNRTRAVESSTMSYYFLASSNCCS